MQIGLLGVVFSPAVDLAVIGLLGLLVGVSADWILNTVQRLLDVRRRLAAVRRANRAYLGAARERDMEFAQPAAATLETLARDRIQGPRIYVTHVTVSSFRCFRELSVHLNHPGGAPGLEHENVNLLLGDNGAGKSTLLKAVALAALGPILDSSGFIPYRLIRNRELQAQVRGAFLTDRPDRTPTALTGAVEISRQGDYERLSPLHDRKAWTDIFEERNASFLVLGYGVNRRVADDRNDRGVLERSRRRIRYERVASLFDESAVLTPLSSWLPDVNSDRRREVEKILARLLPDAELADSAAHETVFHTRGEEVPYRALSDGYKSFIGWVGDLLFQIQSASGGDLPIREVGGIVLVDEVDLLLHPSWQREVIPKIARALPNLQFIFTTHSPIVAGTLEAANILLARTGADGLSTVERLEAEIHGLNAEQILLSSYFALESTRSPDVQDTLTTLATRAMAGDDDAAIEYMRALAGSSRTHPRS